jgi:hypothetical protein
LILGAQDVALCVGDGGAVFVLAVALASATGVVGFDHHMECYNRGILAGFCLPCNN